LRLIHPCQFAVRFDSVIVVQKPEMNRLTPLNGINRVKAKPTVRNVQHDGAVVRLEVDIGEPIHYGPWSLAAFWIHRWHYHPCQTFARSLLNSPSSAAKYVQLMNVRPAPLAAREDDGQWYGRF
jgi:hypothetical protein